MSYALYGTRVLVLLDILGFSEIVKSYEEAPDKFGEIIEALLNIENTVGYPSVKGHLLEGRKATNFSDHIAISQEPTPAGIRAIIAEAAVLSWRLLMKGVATRGAITIGRLHHDATRIMGSALIEAHRLEQYVAIYPRIVVHPEVVKLCYDVTDLAASDLYSNDNCVLRRDNDGIWYAPIFDPDWIGNAFHLKHTNDWTVKFIRPVIKSRLKATFSDQRKFAKWAWLAKRYNAAVASSDFRVIDETLLKNSIKVP